MFNKKIQWLFLLTTFAISSTFANSNEKVSNKKVAVSTDNTTQKQQRRQKTTASSKARQQYLKQKSVAARTNQQYVQQRSTTSNMAPNLDVTPSARGCPGNDGFYASADFILWQADDISSYNIYKNDDPVSENHGSVPRITFDWDPGLKVCVGWNTPYDGWDVSANWIWYQNRSSDTVTSIENNNQGLVLQNQLSDTNNLSTFAEGTYRLDFNMANLQLGRNFYVSKGLSLKPFTGVRGGWINRKTRTIANATAVNANDLVSYDYQAKTNYWGVGPRFGLNGEWRLDYGFNIFGCLSTSLLFGSTSLSADTTQKELATTFTARTTDSFGRVVPNLNLFAGFGWGQCAFNDSMFFGIRLGWEVEYFWNIPHPLLAVGPGNALFTSFDNLGLSGLTLEFKVDF